MKILYAAYRYHTNQVPIMHGWKSENAEVQFFVQYQGAIESHDDVEMHVMKPSSLSRILFKLFDKRYDPVKAENLKIKYFIPDFSDLYNAIKKFMPDVVIIRNYRVIGMYVHAVCKMLGIKNVVIYTQYPIYGIRKGKTLPSRIETQIAPSAIFSPVFYRGEYREKNMKTGMAEYFVPLICDVPQTVRSQYCENGKIRILDIGKYREYKNHFFIVDAIARINHPEKFDVTIIGQLSNDAERAYYQKLEKYISERHLENVIHLRGHVDFKEMDTIYAKHDVLLLASKQETAGMVILEAMSQGLCVVSSINCGLTSYLDEYKCGLSFNTKTPDNLIGILNKMAETPAIIKELGQRAQQITKEEFCFNKYKECLDNLLKKEYNYSLS